MSLPRVPLLSFVCLLILSWSAPVPAPGQNPSPTPPVDTDGDGVPDHKDGWPKHKQLTSPPVPDSQYVAINLGPGVGYGMNNLGDVVGEFYDDNGERQAILWRLGQPPTLLGFLTPDKTVDHWSIAWGINDARQITGRSTYGWDPNVSGEYPDPPISPVWDYSWAVHPFLWQAGSMTDLNDLSFGQPTNPDYPDPTNKLTSEGRGINREGVVVGYSHTNASTQSTHWAWHIVYDAPHAAKFNGAAPIDLGITPTDNDAHGEARAINDNGAIVGSGDYYQNAFFQLSGQTQMISVAPGANIANGLNNLDHVVGQLGNSHAYLWVPTSNLPENERIIDLNTLANFSYSGADAINDRDQIVGSGNGSALLWQNGKVFQLNDLIGLHPSFTLTSAPTINQSGMIVANTSDSPDESEVYLLVPFQLKQSNYPTAHDSTDLGPAKSRQIDTERDAFIAGLPEMARLEATILSGALGGVSVEWRMEVKSERPERGTKDNYRIPQTDETDVVSLPIGQPWNLYDYFVAPAAFFGGDCDLFYRIKGPAGYLDSERSLHFRIRGKNPTDADAKGYIESTQGVYRFAWAMVQQESRGDKTDRVFNQFNPSGPWKERPFFGPPDGWGIAQLDRPFGVSASTAEVYSWHVNIQTFYLELAQKQAFATSYFNALKNYYLPRGKWEEPPTSFVRTGTATSMTALEAATIQLYNGGAWLVEIHNGVMLYDGPYTDDSHGGTRYISCWKFHPNKPSGQKWEFKRNQNNYVYKVIYDEYEGHAPLVE